jgi:predicted permease
MALSDFIRDARVGFRGLARDRTFTATALLTLIVCLGANTAILSIVRSVVLKSLPFPEADRVVLITNLYPKAGFASAGPGDSGTGVPDYFDRLTQTTAFSDQALYVRRSPTLGLNNGAQRVGALAVTASFFPLLRTQASAGRLFLAEDEVPGQDKKVVLSYGFWQREYGGDRSIVGRDIRVNGAPLRVVGVTRPDFRFLFTDTDLFFPLAFTPEQKLDAERHSNNWTNIARLKPGATVDQARRQIADINARNDQRLPAFAKLLRDAGFYTDVTLLQDAVIRDVRPTLYLLWGGVLLVLLVGGVNLANLTLVRSAGRARELATRHALGAELSRLARQLLTETVLLTITGGVIGILVGWWMLRSLGALHLETLPRGDEIGLDVVTAVAIMALSLIVGVLSGLVPIAQLRRASLTAYLREGGRGGTASGAAGRVRRGLATAQVALAFVLLMGAGLLLASFRAVLRIDPGFSSSGVVTAATTLPGFRYSDDQALVDVTARILAQLRALPGVTAAGGTTTIPLGGNNNNSVILAEGYQMKPGESLVSPAQVVVTTGYFEAMGAKLAKGRFFDDRDTPAAPKSIIVDERLAQHFWPNQDPIGRRLYTPSTPNDVTAITPQTQFWSVVGVVKNMQLASLAPRDVPVGAYFFPYTQNTSRSLVFAVRTERNTSTLATAVRNAIMSVDRELPVFGLQTMDARLDRALVPRRVPMIIGLAFGGVALFLAAVGIYGVLAYQVSQRRREIGVRMALGSTATDIVTLVLRDGLRMTGIGLAIGVVGTVGLTRVIGGMLYGVQALNLPVIAVVAIGLTVVATIATLVPARRASRVSPMAALND